MEGAAGYAAGMIVVTLLRRAPRGAVSGSASVTIAVTGVEVEDEIGRDRADLLGAGEHVGVCRLGGEGAFHRGLLGISGGEPVLGVDAGDAEQEEVGGDGAGGFGGGGAAGNGGVLVDAPAEQEDLDGRVLDEGAAIVGLWVMTVACRSAGRARATARVVVPPSRMTRSPGLMSLTARAAMRCLLSGSTLARDR